MSGSSFIKRRSKRIVPRRKGWWWTKSFCCFENPHHLSFHVFGLVYISTILAIVYFIYQKLSVILLIIHITPYKMHVLYSELWIMDINTHLPNRENITLHAFPYMPDITFNFLSGISKPEALCLKLMKKAKNKRHPFVTFRETSGPSDIKL